MDDDVIDRLVERGYVPEAYEDAFRAVDRRTFLEAPYEALADLDVPLPSAPGARPDLSPRACALLLRAVDLAEGTTLLVVGPKDPYLAALAREVTGATVEQVGEAPSISGTWDRILWRPETGETPDVVDDHLAELGVLVHARRRGEDLDVVKVVRTGGSSADVVVSDARVVEAPYGDTGRASGADGDLATLLELESSLARVWTANHLLRRERAWARSVDEVWRSDPPPAGTAEPERGEEDPDEPDDAPPDPDGWASGPDAGLDLEATPEREIDAEPDPDPATWSLARRLFHVGFILQMHGDLETALDVYTASLGTAASAEAHTFRGWTRSFAGDLDGAIADCKRAIATDPSLGNPYNDIGCYLLERAEMGDLDEAEAWFERAMEADRYQAPHFPHLNLARLHLRRGDRDKALEAARESARIAPQDPATREFLRRLEGEGG